MTILNTNTGTALVTGGGRGIGKAICLKLAKVGYRIAINYESGSDEAESTVKEIIQNGGRAKSFHADIGQLKSISHLFHEVEKDLGRITVFVGNAGIQGDFSRTDSQSPEMLKRLFSVNVTGLIICAGEAVRCMSTMYGGMGGNIVLTSSVAARLGGLKGLSSYAATKGAVESFTRALANEVGREGIRVNAIAPGIINTRMAPSCAIEIAEKYVPMGRIGETNEVADVVAWLISPQASYVTGTIISVSGGR